MDMDILSNTLRYGRFIGAFGRPFDVVVTRQRSCLPFIPCNRYALNMLKIFINCVQVIGNDRVQAVLCSLRLNVMLRLTTEIS
jgi:hypothetical protein